MTRTTEELKSNLNELSELAQDAKKSIKGDWLDYDRVEKLAKTLTTVAWLAGWAAADRAAQVRKVCHKDCDVCNGRPEES